ncbi:MAG: choice-of-anchor J domain-containing protein [Flavobacteriales bacterium]|nr:choice-of-anchor J domain-containing protein [Flavobacteriales bacterium]
MKNFKRLLYLLALTVTICGCTKEYDAPTVKSVPVGNVLTIAEVRALHVPGTETHITQDISVFGVVTADETTGNIYKEAYIQDETGALYLRFTTSSGVYIGDSIRVYLKGTKILRYNQMLQVDSVHPDNNIVKVKTQQYRTPELVTISALNANKEFYQGKLVQIDGVFFIDAGQSLTYADGVNKVSISRKIQDVSTNQIDVRTSGYANFANDTLPDGGGTFIGIAGQFNSTMQLIIRNPNELQLNGEKPSIKNFQDQSLTSGGWSVENVSGTINWVTSDLGSTGNFYAKVDNTNAKLVGETWFVSPALDFTNSNSPYATFRSATFAGNSALQVYILTNYSGGNPNSGTLTEVFPTLSSGSWTWTSSGNIDLSSYKQSNVRIAFKYTGYSSSWNTWELDDIIIIP